MKPGEPGALYRGAVRHRRFAPRAHALRYRLFMLLVDLDQLPALGRSLKLFGYNRPALIAHYDRDHGDGSGADLRGHIVARLREAGLALAPQRITLLAMPRLFGFVFNPLSVYFCYDGADALAAIVYEVKNTFGERHDYVLPVTPGEGRVRHACAKQFFVSPFLPMALTYAFDLAPPGEAVSVAMRVSGADGLLLTAAFAGKAEPLTDAALARAVLTQPTMTFGALAAIHWEALKLLAKGVPFLGRRGASAALSVTAVTSQPARSR